MLEVRNPLKVFYEYHKGLEGHIHFPKKEVIQKFYTMDGQWHR